MYETSKCGRSFSLPEEVLRKKNRVVFLHLMTVELLLLLLLDGGSSELWEEQFSHSRERRHKQRLSQEGKGSPGLYQI